MKQMIGKEKAADLTLYIDHKLLRHMQCGSTA